MPDDDPLPIPPPPPPPPPPLSALRCAVECLSGEGGGYTTHQKAKAAEHLLMYMAALERR